MLNISASSQVATVELSAAEMSMYDESCFMPDSLFIVGSARAHGMDGTGPKLGSRSCPC
jgi:hypothetical protein